ncbi:hypothetical protein [Breoghania sp.]|uniref:hypothetical protein n=1 Tax=Breoghania sp. TaxID=2065378 RepID=UPI002AAB856A|nr:hypothetical protein [Breoghania sp.]
MQRGGHRLSAVLCGAMLALAASLIPAGAVNGWREDFGTLTHHSGLSCPDRIGALERFEVAGTTATMLASCTYRTNNLYLMVQIWEQGYLLRATRDYRDHFVGIGFPQVTGSGVARKGLTFIVARSSDSQRRETIWPISIGRRGLVLWMNYAYPGDNKAVEAAYNDMVETLRSMK